MNVGGEIGTVRLAKEAGVHRTTMYRRLRRVEGTTAGRGLVGRVGERRVMVTTRDAYRKCVAPLPERAGVSEKRIKDVEERCDEFELLASQRAADVATLRSEVAELRALFQKSSNTMLRRSI